MNWQLAIFVTVLALFAFQQSAQAQSAPLPQDGALYYLVHTNSGKYVQVSGGSSSPGDGTKLVYWDAEQKLSDRFQFVTINGYRQLQHYSSGKYVNPDGGNVGNQAALLLWSTQDGARTAMDMESSGGYSYLFKADVSASDGGTYYVHPNGGSDSPSNGDVLVFYEDYRVGIAVGIVPAENFTILTIEFDIGSINDLFLDAIVVSKTITNNADVPITSVASVQYSETVTNTFSFSFTESIGISVSSKFQAGIPGLADGTVSVGVTFSFASTQTQTTTTTDGVQISDSETVTVPPHTSVTLSMITSRKSGTVPFVATAQNARGNIVTIRGNVDIKYLFNQQVILTEPQSA